MKDRLWNILTLIAVGSVAFVVKGATSDLKELRSDVNGIGARVVAIENNRLSTSNGLEIQKQLADIRESLARLETEIRLHRSSQSYSK